MALLTDSMIRDFQARTGIQAPPHRECAILRAMQAEAFELIKAAELEISGIRDGDGLWHGSDASNIGAKESCERLMDWLAALLDPNVPTPAETRPPPRPF